MKQVQQYMITQGCFGPLAVEEGEILTQIEERRKQEEIMWKHKSKVQWLREGEINTCFFHKEMIQYRHHIRIFSLHDSEGNRLVQHEDMETLLVDHFHNLLSEPCPDRSEVIEQITRHIP